MGWGFVDREAGGCGADGGLAVGVEDVWGAVEQEGDGVVGAEYEGVWMEEREDADADCCGFAGELGLGWDCQREEEQKKDGSRREYPLIA